MDLILSYVDRRKFVKRAIDRVQMRCRQCEGRGHITANIDHEKISRTINRAMENMESIGPTFGAFARQAGRMIFTQIATSRFNTSTCPTCSGECFVPAVEHQLTPEEREEAIRMYVNHLKKEEKIRKRTADKSKTWDRKSNRGDPRYK